MLFELCCGCALLLGLALFGPAAREVLGRA